MEKYSNFFYSIKSGDLKELKKLLSESNNIFQIKPYNQSLLLLATLEDNLPMVRYLIERGFNPNEGDEDNYTPLHACAENNFYLTAKYLLHHNANPNIGDKNGNTPLLKAIMHWDKNLETIKVLLDGQANPYQENKSGMSAFSLAVEMKSDAILSLITKQ